MIRDNESGSIFDLESYEVDQMRICSLYVQITIWIRNSFISDKKFETNQNQMKKMILNMFPFRSKSRACQTNAADNQIHDPSMVPSLAFYWIFGGIRDYRKEIIVILRNVNQCQAEIQHEINFIRW